eukprot:12499828-Prorocentrum_lima.AAC.1
MGDRQESEDLPSHRPCEGRRRKGSLGPPPQFGPRGGIAQQLRRQPQPLRRQRQTVWPRPQ